MDDWPLEIDGQEYHPLPESWVDHGIDECDPDGPQLLAVSAGTFRTILRVRYAHPRYDSVGEMRFPGTQHNGGLVPEDLPDSWPRSIGAAALDPVDIRRKPEQQHLETLWADRVDDVLEDVEPRFTSEKIVADGGDCEFLALRECESCGQEFDAADPQPTDHDEDCEIRRRKWPRSVDNGGEGRGE